MPTTFSRFPDWDKLEKSSMTKQQEVVVTYQDEFDKVPIMTPDCVWVGDHLVDEGKFYSHHMLCTANYGDRVKVIHYTGPNLGSLGTFRGITCKDIGVLGKIQEEEWLIKQLVKRKIQKYVWPVKMMRFSVEETIERARSRQGESYYDFLKNNCEHFVTWSRCGLKVSLQVKNCYLQLREIVYSLVAGGYDYGRKKASDQLVPLVMRIIANTSDEAAALITNYGHYVGYGLAVAIEGGLAVHEIHKAFKQREKGVLIATDEQFNAKIFGIVAKALCRVGFGVTGSVLGASSGPLGSLLWGAVGAGVGHFVGAVLGWVFENRAYLDG